MKILFLKTLMAVLVCSWSSQAWSHGGSEPGPMAQPRSGQASQPNAAQVRQGRLEKLQEKIDKIDAKLESSKLSAKKRAKLEKKLKELLKQKQELLDSAP